MLSQRVAKARSIVKAGLCHQVNSRAWQVPGSDGKRYLVTRRKKTNEYRCVLECGGYGQQPCKGNSNGAVCYHVIQAIISAALEAKREVSFCESQADAERLSRLGGTLYKVSSGQGRGKVWIVVQ